MGLGEELPGEAIVGRGREADELLALLLSARFVTVTALGGAGKTRLAREVARRWAAAGRRAVWVDLSPVPDADLVPARVLEAMDADAPGDEDEAVVAAMGDEPVLLVLDNAEQVAAAGRRVAGWLRAAPSASALVTSRVPLRAPGERRYPLGPLAPEEAAELFTREVERLGGSVGPDERSRVGDLCAAVDGSPLALEIAAARAAVVGVEQTAIRLASGPPEGVGAVVEWALSNLSPDDRDCALLLGAFPGPLGAGLLGALWALADAAPTAARLADVGILRRGASAGVLEVLVPVREALAARLDDSARSAALARCRALLERTATTPTRHADLGPMRYALDAVLRDVEASPEAAAALLWGLARPLRDAGLARDVAYWAERLLGAGGLGPGLRAAMLEARAWALLDFAGPSAALPVARDAVAAAADAPTDVAARAWTTLAGSLDSSGDLDAAAAAYAEALRLAREAGDPWLESVVLGNLGVHLVRAGAIDAGRRELRAAAAASVVAGRVVSEALALGNLAALLDDGDPEQVDLARRAWALLEPTGASTYAAWAATNLACALLSTGAVEEARRHLPRCAELVAASGGVLELQQLADTAALLAVISGRAVSAARLLGAAEGLRRRAGAGIDPPARSPQSAWSRTLAALGQPAFDRHLAEGGALDAEAILEALRAEIEAPPPAARVEVRYGRLSPRERQVLALVAEGATDPEIGHALGVSTKTASVHVANLKGKTGAVTRIELAVLGRRLLGLDGEGRAVGP